MMATKIKYKKIDPNFVKKNYPVLYDTVEDVFKNSIGIKAEIDANYLKKNLYGLCIEIALKSDGTVDLFEDDLPDDFLKDIDDEF